MSKSRGAAKPQIKVRRILVPTDFSSGAQAALNWASALAGTFGAEMLLLHVLDVRLAAIAGLPPDLAAMPAVDELVQSVSAEAEQQMQALAARFPDARTILKEGVPRVIILEVAKAEGADLIVLGTHGRTGLSHVLFGSVAEHVVRHSHVPVLTVRQQNVA
ncbi:MAG: universal stress protein [Armatimonadota bacterium]